MFEVYITWIKLQQIGFETETNPRKKYKIIDRVRRVWLKVGVEYNSPEHGEILYQSMRWIPKHYFTHLFYQDHKVYNDKRFYQYRYHKAYWYATKNKETYREFMSWVKDEYERISKNYPKMTKRRIVAKWRKRRVY